MQYERPLGGRKRSLIRPPPPRVAPEVPPVCERPAPLLPPRPPLVTCLTEQLSPGAILHYDLSMGCTWKTAHDMEAQ